MKSRIISVSKLVNAMKDKGITHTGLSSKLGITRMGLYDKLHYKSRYFTEAEILTLLSIFGLTILTKEAKSYIDNHVLALVSKAVDNDNDNDSDSDSDK